MIQNLDKTLRALLINELGIDPEQVAFDQPSGDWSSRISRPTLNLFLYDVRENNSLRRHQWQQTNGTNGMVGLKRTPLFMDCFYLVSAWRSGDDITKAFDEHQLLSNCMVALARYPILNPEFSTKNENEVIVKGGREGQKGAPQPAVTLEAAPTGRTTTYDQLAQREWFGDPVQNLMLNQSFQVHSRIANHDVLTNPAEVWSALENQMKAAFSYVVTLQLDPWDKSVQLAEQVGGLEIITGQGAVRPVRDSEDKRPVDPSDRFEGDDKPAPEKMARIDEDALGGALYRLAGRVWNKAVEPKQPAVSVPISIMEPDILAGTRHIGTLRHSETDRLGRFSFRRLEAGEYMVVVGEDLDDPLAAENILIRPSKETRKQASTGDEENIIINIEVELPTPQP